MIDAHLDPPLKPWACDVASNGQQRRAIQPGAADAGREIGRARSDSGNANAGDAGQISDSTSHESSRSFAGGEHELNRATTQRIDQRQHRPARHAEHPAHAGPLKGADDEITVVHVRFLTLAAWRGISSRILAED